MPDVNGLLTLEEFKTAVGASFESVRIALRVLRIEPITSLADRRVKRYRPEWVETVRGWILQNVQNNAS
jgi:hypothetical protein